MNVFINRLNRSHDGSVLMFSSADGYCSAAVFSDGELGTRYEKQPEPVEEYDVEMMDIASHTNLPTGSSSSSSMEPITEVVKAQKRRVSITPSDPVVVHTTTILENPKKRRITPILISTPLQTMTTTSATTTDNK